MIRLVWGDLRLWMAVALTLCGVVIAMFIVLLAANCYYEKKY